MPGGIRHRRTSGIGSDGDPNHVQGSNWDDTHTLTGALADRQAPLSKSAATDKWDWDWVQHGDVFATLLNTTGATCAQGDVVNVGSGAATLDDTLASLNAFAVAADPTLTNGTSGRFWRGGLIPTVKTDGPVSAGHYVVKSPTSRAIRDSGVVAGSATVPPVGALGIAASSVGSAAFISAFWFSAAPVAPGATAPPVTAGYLKGTGSGYTVQAIPIPLSDLDSAAITGLIGSATSFSADPETQRQTLWEDFLPMGGAVGASGPSWAYPWTLQGGVVTDAAGAEGIISLGGDSATRPSLVCTALAIPQAKNPTLYARWAQLTSTAGTRRIGVADNGAGATFGTALEPINGIYFRHTAAGTIVAVARSGATESTVSTGVTAASGTFHTGRLVITGTASVAVYLDGVLKGTLTTNIPSVALLLGAGGDAVTSGVGLQVDYLVMRGSR